MSSNRVLGKLQTFNIVNQVRPTYFDENQYNFFLNLVKLIAEGYYTLRGMYMYGHFVHM